MKCNKNNIRSEHGGDISQKTISFAVIAVRTSDVM
jgi:hypothetical protein